MNATHREKWQNVINNEVCIYYNIICSYARCNRIIVVVVQEIAELNAELRDLLVHLEAQEKMGHAGLSADELAQSQMLLGEPAHGAAGASGKSRRKKHK